MYSNITEDLLKKVLDFEVIGTEFPYNTADFDEVQKFLQEVRCQFLSQPLLDTRIFMERAPIAASYMHLFCSKKEGRLASFWRGKKTTAGISIYMCYYAPVATYGLNQLSKSAEDMDTVDYLCPENVGFLPQGNWNAEKKLIEKILRSNGFEILLYDQLNKEIPFETGDNVTLLRKKPFKVFDAFFSITD